MMFGTKRIGLECQILRSDSNACIGNLWLWADGVRLGDEVSGVDLPLVLAALSGPLHLTGRRHHAPFDGMNSDVLASCFQDMVFEGVSLPDCDEQLARLFRRYLLISAPDLEGFDSVFLLLIGAANGDRLIWKYKEEPHAQEILLMVNEYDLLIVACLGWLETVSKPRLA